jgi:outer membrane protein
MAGITLTATPLVAQAQRVAYLDSRRILAEAPGAQEARTLIQGEMARFQSQVQVLDDSLSALVAEYQRKSVLLSPDAKKREEDALSQKQQSFNQRVQAIQAQASKRQDELMKPVMDRVQKAIEELRKEGGYAIIFDAANAGMVSADSTLDLTTQVIAKLKGQPGNGSGARSSSPRNPRNPPSRER